MIVRACLPSVATVMLVLLGCASWDASAVGAEGLRVENKVFLNEDKEPRSQSTTIFHEGLVYDFLDKPAEITIFDLGHHRFVLLDPTRRVRTELSTDEVAALCENLRTWAKRQTDPLIRFMADPQFEQQRDDAAGEIAFTSQWMTYRVATTPAPSEAVARQYREFSDWYTRLNARLNPGSKLPFARLGVNQVLERRQELPREVRLTIQPKRGSLGQKHVARSEHSLTTRLSQADEDRIGQVEQFMAIFQPVDFERYQENMGR